MKKIMVLVVAIFSTFSILACDVTSNSFDTTLPITSTSSITESPTTSTTGSTTSTTSLNPTTTFTTTTNTTTNTTTSPTTTNTTTSTSNSTVLGLMDQIPTECQHIPIESGWIPVWCDEFEESFGESIVDPNKWVYEVGTGNWGWGNNEAQYYTYRDPDNTKVEEGFLKIIALRENFGGKEYTSTRLRTRLGTEFKYGKFEMRAKLPFGRGTWVAFWMMPRNSVYGGWPASGEIDIMEHVGYDMNVVHGTIHTDRFNGTNGRGGSTRSLITSGQIAPFSVVNDFHTYGVEWEEGKITWFFDGLAYASVSYDPNLARNSYLYPTNIDWPFDQAFYLILNFAIGGQWGGAQGIDNSIFPQTFTIDYVRVFQKEYVVGDQENPSMISNFRVLHKTSSTAYITWNEATDDMRVKGYLVFVDGQLKKTTDLWGTQLTGLLPGDRFISIYAEDYAGNLSEVFETVITIE